MRSIASRKSSSCGKKTMRKWSGAGQLKPVPCTSMTRGFLQQFQEELAVVFDRVNRGVQAGNMYSAAVV